MIVFVTLLGACEQTTSQAQQDTSGLIAYKEISRACYESHLLLVDDDPCQGDVLRAEYKLLSPFLSNAHLLSYQVAVTFLKLMSLILWCSVHKLDAALGCSLEVTMAVSTIESSLHQPGVIAFAIDDGEGETCSTQVLPLVRYIATC